MRAPSTLDTSLRDESDQVARQLSDRFAWHLLSPQDLGKRIYRAAQADGLPDTLSTTGPPLARALERIAIGLYAEQLYRDCQRDGSPEQNRAFVELMNFLYLTARRLALEKLPKGPQRSEAADEIARDCTSRVAARLYQSLKLVRAPTAFLAFAQTSIVRDTIDEINRRKHSPIDTSKEIGSSNGKPGLAEAEQAEYRSECREILLSAIQSLANPRQQVAIVKSFLREMDDADIALELAVSVTSVPKLRQRALQALRRDKLLLDELVKH